MQSYICNDDRSENKVTMMTMMKMSVIVHVPVASMIISKNYGNDEDVSDSSCASGLLLLVCPPPTQVCPAHSTDFHICPVSIRQKYTKK